MAATLSAAAAPRMLMMPGMSPFAPALVGAVALMVTLNLPQTIPRLSFPMAPGG